MARYSETTSVLGSRIMEYRRTYDLTQADLAERYGVSGPAIFKFEKGFVTPSLKLWQKIAANIGVPEKEAVLIWVREKLPAQMKNLVCEVPTLDVEALRADVGAASKEPQAQKKMRAVLQANPDLSPALKRFVSSDEMWGTLKPTADELIFLIDLTQSATIHDVNHFRDAMIIARAIENPGD